VHQAGIENKKRAPGALFMGFRYFCSCNALTACGRRSSF
jgi:hypothetical protein